MCMYLCVRWVDGPDPSRHHGVSAQRSEGADRPPDPLWEERWRRAQGERHGPLGGLERSAQHRVTASNTLMYSM